MDSVKEERLFYIKHGERTEEKCFMLDKCLVMVALQWHKKDLKSACYGKHLQPSTWEKMMKYLFSIFRKKNVN
jgi:hypothetical protein